jgi:hypothetical protein
MARERDRKKSFLKDENDEEFNRAFLSSIEDEWMAARLRGDTGLTERLLDEGYRGTTSDGLPQTKAEFVRTIELSRLTSMSADHTDRNIGVHGDVAVSSGLATLRALDRQHSFRYLRVYRKSRGEWRLIASQSTRVREA